jgi:hypothetical protein
MPRTDVPNNKSAEIEDNNLRPPGPWLFAEASDDFREILTEYFSQIDPKKTPFVAHKDNVRS